MLNKCVLARLVTGVLTVYLGYRHVAFVENHQEVVWEVVEQCERRLTRLPSVEIARVVLDS